MRKLLMNKRLIMLGLGLCLAWPAPVAQAADAGLVKLAGHVPAALAKMPATGRLTATNLNLAIGLPLRNKEALTNLLRQIGDPQSSIYHKYLTPEQFANLFGPSRAGLPGGGRFCAAASFAGDAHPREPHAAGCERPVNGH